MTLIILFCGFCLTSAIAQEKIPPPVRTEPPTTVEEQLEDLTEANEDAVPDDDSFLQDMMYFLKEPINLNYADEGLLQQLKLLSPIQIANLLLYRKAFGNFLHHYEIQAVPYWDIQTIQKILPYITVSEKADVVKSISSRLKGGDQTLLVRGTQVLEKSKGNLIDSNTAKNFYPGSPQRVLVRYRYKYKNSLQYGVTAEKDAGEQFFRGAQKDGFDFYSAHFFVKDIGMIKSIALGDFSVNLGQGLTSWQSLSFNKGAEILNIKRQSETIRPYNSAGEVEFHRGAAITLGKKNWEATALISYRKLDASFKSDTLEFEEYVSSLQISGLHRTASEVAAKNKQGQFTVGGNIKYNTDRFHIGVNAINYHFELPIKKQDVAYNQFALSGKQLRNYSVDYSYTFKNMHLFGEVAMDNNHYKAIINGLAISASSKVDMSFLHRKISKGYQSLYSSAFTENTRPNNESGFFTGLAITPTDYIKINAYADLFKFPWIKYRTDAPTSGADYMIQLTYKPNRQVEIYSRYRSKNKPVNFNPENAPLNPVVAKARQGFRTQFSYKLNPTFTLRSRVELSWYDKKGKNLRMDFSFIQMSFTSTF
ncbi:MAG: helix-hairpin-helix domain-containing protein [Ginsengibacter sp.]